MAALNRAAGEVLAASGAVSALTDVTGFGLLGHAWEMVSGSKVSLRIAAPAVPLIAGVLDLARDDVAPGGSRANLDWVREHVDFDDGVEAALRLVLADAQTNGGLLAAVAPERAKGLLVTLATAGVGAADVGEVVEAEGESRIGVAAQ
jgi:selenide,water dikinase